MKQLLLLSVFLISILGCTTKADPDKAPEKSGSTANASQAVVHDVKCGCSIEAVGKCGNYILIADKFVPLVNPTLGPMEFCKFKKAGAKIETKGAMKDGKFVAESWKLIQ